MSAPERTPDYYQVLGVSRTASSEELQQAYRRAARKHHPDVNRSPDAEERFKEINDAYHVLSDPKTRARYDRYGARFREIPEGYEESFGGRGRPGAGFRGAGAGRGQPFPGEWEFRDSDIDLEELLGGMFGGRGRGTRAAAPIAGADQDAELELGVEEAYRGGRRSISLAGAGAPRTFEVNIPAGVTNGQRIRLAGQGGQGRGDGPPGDLYLIIRIAPHPRYRLEDRDMYVDLPVTPSEGALGAEVPVTTPDGEVTVRVPAGSSTGRRLRLRGRGMPNPKGTPGDLYAEVKVMVPPRVDGRERELYEELAKVSTVNPRKGR